MKPASNLDIFGVQRGSDRYMVPVYSIAIAILLNSGLLAGAAKSIYDTDPDQYGGGSYPTMGENHHQMCYSCMSSDKEQTWGYLQHVYHKPLNFTDQCNRPMVANRMGLVPCSSVCVVITEMRLVSGHFAGYSFTRGCIHSIAKNGFRNTTLRDYHFELRPSCERLPRNAVFYKSNPTIEDQIYFCTCFGDRCNDDRLTSGGASSSRLTTSLRLLPTNWNIIHFDHARMSAVGFVVERATNGIVQLVLSSLAFPLGWTMMFLLYFSRSRLLSIRTTARYDDEEGHNRLRYCSTA